MVLNRRSIGSGNGRAYDFFGASYASCSTFVPAACIPPILFA